MRRPALALALLALLAAGCAYLPEAEDGPPEEVWSDYQPPAPEEEPDTPAEPAYPAALSLPYDKNQTLDPVTCGEGIQDTAAALLYEPLFRLDGRFEPVPLLCESWSWDETGLVCTLEVREGVTFSDGSPLTARDVEETLLRAVESERYAYRLRSVAAVAANRAGQVVITLSAPNRALPALLDVPIVKRGTAGDRVPLGTGPYVLAGEGGAERLAAREDWWRGKTLPVRDIPLVHAKDRDTAMHLFSTRQVELLAADPTDDPSLASGQSQTTPQPTAIMQFVGFNAAEGRLFADPALRALFSRGVDRETLAFAQLAKLATAAQFPVSPLSPLYPKELEAAYSEEEVLSALRAAGQNTGEIRELTLLVAEGDGFRSASARFIAERLSLLDWRITVAELPWESYLAALEAGEFDLYFGEVRLTADWDLTDLVGTEGALNYGGYANETTDILLQLFAAAEDRADTARRLYSHLQSTAPLAPICFKEYSVLTHPGVVEGLSPAPAYVFQDMDKWTVRLSAADGTE